MGQSVLKRNVLFSQLGGSGGGSGVLSVNSGTNITVDNTDPANPIINSTADDITVAANYSAILALPPVAGEFYWASSSQGTSWLPGSLGGTYYDSGLYYYNGVTLEFMDVPYQATQAEVNTGTNTNKFVTPDTLTNWTGRYWSKTGSIVELTTASDQLELQGPVVGATGTFHIKAGDSVNQYIVLSEAVASPNSAFLTFKSSGGNAIAMGARFSAGAPLSYVFTDPSGLDIITINTTTGSLSFGAGTTPQLIGGSAAASKLSYVPSTNAAVTAGIGHQWYAGNNGTSSKAVILHTGYFGVGTTAPETWGHFAGTYISGRGQLCVQGTGGTTSSAYPTVSFTDSANARIGLFGYAGYGGADSHFYFANEINGSWIFRNSSITVATLTTSGFLALGSASAPNAGFEVTRTTEQIRTRYDASNYYSTTVASTGATSFVITGSSKAFQFGNSSPSTWDTKAFRVGEGTSTVDIGGWRNDPSKGVIIFNQTSNDSGQYALRGDATTTWLNAKSSVVNIAINDTNIVVISDARCLFTPNVQGSGIINPFKINIPASTGQTASAEVISFWLDAPSSIQWATGALATQRFAYIEQPTYRFVGASTITNAATLAIQGAPIASTNATITNSYALWVQAGTSQFDGNIVSGGATSTIRLKGYTVATLPAGVVGDTAYVTDALGPAFLVAVVGGGAVTTTVFYNGATWVAQ